MDKVWAQKLFSTLECSLVSSFFCVEKDLLCSSEQCFVYYLKIQATESFEISQKKCTLSHSYEHPAFFNYDLPVIFIPNYTQILGFFIKKY
jgi:hypothetical protein